MLSQFFVDENPFSDYVIAEWVRLLGGFPAWLIHREIDEYLSRNERAPKIRQHRWCRAEAALRADRLTLGLLRRAAQEAAIAPVR